MVLLRITYRLRAHHMTPFETIFRERILPIAREHELAPEGFWRTSVGEVGEYMELWRFESITDFDQRWRGLLADARIQEIFQTTGPMVEGENFTILESAL